MCLKFHSLPVTSHDTTKCKLYGREGLEKFVVQVVLLGCSQNQKNIWLFRTWCPTVAFFKKKKIWTELKGGISRLRPRDWEERNRYLIFQILVLNKQEIKMFPLIVCNVDALPFNVNMRAREVLINHIGLRLWWRAFFQDSWHGWIIFLLKCENNTDFLLSFTLDWYVK